MYRLRTYEDYLAHQSQSVPYLEQHMKSLELLASSSESRFYFDGYSYLIGKQGKFLVDRGLSGEINWRETVNCVATGFNNRMRATINLLDIEMELYPNSKIYLTEQITPIYKYFLNRFSDVTGSEFLGKELPFGSVNKEGVRNETLCALSFTDQFFDAIVSLDVLEHIPDYLQAFSECARVLKPGGKMMWSVPFVPNSHENLVRAKLENGEIIHILSPEYHGDPLSTEGVLCFQHFGWEMLGQMRSAGFSDAYALCYHSTDFGYLGGEQFMFMAIK